jgi:hypothetical protein
LGRSDVDWHADRRIEAVACVGRDMIKLWLLSVESRGGRMQSGFRAGNWLPRATSIEPEWLNSSKFMGSKSQKRVYDNVGL